ncbi:syncoilin [Betta splendens]|uniref:Syncoilin n=1 Tax=Betta splendens TaxID=158456 RepID=A0A6P7NVF9_BETSP|nr:syncoilin [Betta splendens]
MEDMEDDASSAGVDILFIKEDDRDPNRSIVEHREGNTTQSGLSFTRVQLNPSALIGPYLQEMDDLLKSCEELTGLPFTSRFSGNQDTDEVTMKSYTGINAPPQTYPSSSYIDTHVHGAGSKSTGTANNRKTDMPLTSAGKALSETMVQVEGQLLGMLAMMDSSVEDTRMDFESQGWTTDTSQEYVHIGPNPHVSRERESQEAQPMQLERTDHDTTSKNSSFKAEQKDLDALTFSRPTKPLDTEESDAMCCEGTKTEYMFTIGTEAEVDICETHMPDQQDVTMDMTLLRSGADELQGLEAQMEACIEGVQLLYEKRKKLLVEVLELRGEKDRGATEESNEETEEAINGKVTELMNVLQKEEEARREERKREIHNLKEERAEEERRVWKINLERQGLQDELRKMRRRLFIVARDCAHSQATLNSQHRAVQLLKTEDEQLQAVALQLTEEGCQIRTTQQKLLLELQARLDAHSSGQTPNTQEELTECRRHSCGDIQQYVQGVLRALEDRYEPILLALLKRREAAAAALVKAKEQAQELKAQLGPLTEEAQKLKLQKACLEEKFKLIRMHWREDVGQYKETVCCLEERSRELKTELKIQKKKTKETEGLRDSLAKQLRLYMAATEEHSV